jgi:hypothetical protein
MGTQIDDSGSLQPPSYPSSPSPSLLPVIREGGRELSFGNLLNIVQGEGEWDGFRIPADIDFSPDKWKWKTNGRPVGRPQKF